MKEIGLKSQLSEKLKSVKFLCMILVPNAPIILFVTRQYSYICHRHCRDGATRSGLYAATSLSIDRMNCDNELDVLLSSRYITNARPQAIASLVIPQHMHSHVFTCVKLY
jgi:hypothetical protein